MKIEIPYFPDCLNYLHAVEHLQIALPVEHVSADGKHMIFRCLFGEIS